VHFQHMSGENKSSDNMIPERLQHTRRPRNWKTGLTTSVHSAASVRWRWHFGPDTLIVKRDSRVGKEELVK
jgi:hypothetical protein